MLATALQASPASFAGHPEGQALYVDIPDAQGFLVALESTPATSFLATESMGTLLGLLGEDREAPASLGARLAAGAGLPGLEPFLAKTRGLSLSIAGLEQGAAALLLFEMDQQESAQGLQSLLASSWGAEPGVPGELWKAQVGSAPVWMLSQGAHLALGTGPSRLASALDFGSTGEPSGLQGRLAASGLNLSGEAPQPIHIWLVHDEEPLPLLAKLDADLGLFGGQFMDLGSLSLGQPMGVARLAVSSAGYSLDCFEPGSPSQGVALDQSLVDQVSDKAMFVMSWRAGSSQWLSQIQALFEFTGTPMESLGEQTSRLEALFALLEVDAIIYSNSMNSVSPPKSYLSIGIKPGEGSRAAVLAACSETLSALTGLPVTQRDYRVKNKQTKERLSFPVYTLVMPKDPNRTLLTPSISPSFTVMGERLLLSPRSTYLKNELKRRFDGKGLSAESLGPLRSRALLLPTEVQSVMMLDWADQVASLIAFFPMLAMLLPDLPFGPGDLPSAAEVKRAFPPVFGYSQATEQGSLHHYQSALGLEALLLGLKLYAKTKGSLGNLRAMLPF